MSQRHVLRRQSPPEPTLDLRAVASRSVPADILADGAKRLRLICLVAVATMLSYIVVLLLTAPRDSSTWAMLPRWTAALGAGSLLSLIVWAAARSPRAEPVAVLKLGLFYLVSFAFTLGVYRHARPWVDGEGFRDFSAIAVLLIFFSALIPVTPRQLLGAGLAACFMDLAGLLLWARWGNPLPPVYQALMIETTTLMGLGIAYATATVLHRLRRSVGEARDLGAYELLEKLGEGGMGEVWRARHRLLLREAAVKLLHARTDTLGHSPDGRRALIRFEREVRATARLSSPHTVAVYDFGTAEDGTLYYAMELLDGLDLEALVERFGPLPASRTIHVLQGICQSLAEAHEAGLVHRDIKPANVFLCRVGLQCDFVKVLDFGLAKRGAEKTAEFDEHGRPVGGTGLFTGTPAYAAPELLAGADRLDGRTDLYSLGCVAFWLLTGRQVFPTEGVMATVIEHLRTTPERPSRFTSGDVPPALEALVLSCLEKSPGARPASAAALLDALGRIAVSETWTEERAATWWNEHKPTESFERAA